MRSSSRREQELGVVPGCCYAVRWWLLSILGWFGIYWALLRVWMRVSGVGEDADIGRVLPRPVGGMSADFCQMRCQRQSGVANRRGTCYWRGSSLAFVFVS